MDKQLFTYTLRLADDGLILGHRLSEMCSKGPILEEDLALTNIALDYIGRSQALLDYAAKIEGQGKDADHYAYRRPENEYLNHLLTEQPNTDFAWVIARQFFFSAYEFYFYQELQKSKDAELAAIASKTVKEVKYHLEHAADWMVRLGDGTEESHQRLFSAVNYLYMFTGELFEMDSIDMDLVKKGIAVDKEKVKIQWQKCVEKVVQEATLSLPNSAFMQTGSRAGVHSELLGHLLSEMQYLQRAYPDAKW